MGISSVHFYLLIFLSILSVANCLNISEWEEGPCRRMPQTTTVDNEDSLSWSSENDINDESIYYTPLISKYELYESASIVSDIPLEDLTDDFIKKSCMFTKTEKGRVTMHGFNGKEKEVIMAPGKHGGFLWKIKGDKKYRGEFWMTLFSKNYAVSVTCWASGRHSFSVASTTKQFDAETGEKLIKYVTSLGFNPKYIVDYSYEECKDV